MFLSQDSIDHVESGRKESVSPVRKKGRGKVSLYRKECLVKDVADTPNVFGMSQDSIQFSQFSQNFTDRMGQLNMCSSQDYSNISNLVGESSFSVPFLPPVNPICTTFTGSIPSIRNTISKSIPSIQNNPSFETERPIDIAAPIKNVFLQGVKPHCELQLDNFDPHNPPTKRSTKIWIGAFKERPRIVTEFEELKMLGEGTFSTVFCVRHRLDGTLYAIKRIRENITTERQGHLLVREPCALAALQGCPQIIRYYGCWLDNHRLYIQTEWCHLGSLEDLIARKPQSSSILSMASRAASILSAIFNNSNSKNTYRASNQLNAYGTSKYPTPSTGLPTDTSPEKKEDNNDPTIVFTKTPITTTTYQRERSGSFTEQMMISVGNNNNNNNNVSNSKNASSKRNPGSNTDKTSSSSNTKFCYNTTDAGISEANCINGNNNNNNNNDCNSNTNNNCNSGNADNNNTSPICNHHHNGISEDLAWLILYDISCALAYMHERGNRAS